MAIGVGTDIGLVIVAIAVMIGGWRRGALVGAGSLAGLICGFLVGGRLRPIVLDRLTHAHSSLADHPVIVSAVVLLGCALILQSVGYAIAAAIRRRMGDGIVHGVDSLGGTVLSLFTLGLVVWLAAGFVRTTPLITANEAVTDSKIINELDRAAPIPSDRAMSDVAGFLQDNGFPRVFSGGNESGRSVDAPDRTIPKAVRNASGSVVKVLATESMCQRGSEGTGWVTTGDRVVTNAHVVAGSDRIVVQERGVGDVHTARLIAFDPRRDVAVLKVDGLDAAALSTAGRLARGDSAVLTGYPGNGPYTQTPARVRQTLSAAGLDIYGRHLTERDIYSLRAEVRPGDSGGPLFDDQGKVAGMVFARSTSDPDTGYALTLSEVKPVLKKSAAGSTVPAGQCISE
ncbi:MarP family serine protease [Microlunatus elymi]|uniref:MarP family serine protease n=1 Tax=Microlunatus elymi TaxID=2596828 RepID=A0A516Q0G4_9ACTN|nr:MarP family serine protease [Microlunatus elymi]QDP96924.1 MarP family serine protease [Microlunatus elymi]